MATPSVEIATVAATAFSAVFQEIYKGATSTFKKYLDKRNLDEIAESIRVDFGQISQVRKLFVADRVDLKSFYYPLDIIHGRPGSRISVKCIDQISKDKNIIIFGTAGQGKSMFMRNLAVNDYIFSLRVPVFIELRYLKEDKNLISLLSQHFQKIGFPELDEKLLIHILRSGKFSIFLDGVDEVSRTVALEFKGDLERLFGACPKCRFTLSSRKGSLANLTSNDSSLIDVQLAKIEPNQISKFLIRLGCSAEKAEFLFNIINEPNSKIIKILNTPLLLDLFRHTYGTSGNIPNNIVDFYTNIYHTLVFHHDAAKELYARERATSLDNSQLLVAFENFSFFSKDYGVSLDHTEFINCSENTKMLMNRSDNIYSFTPEGLKTDLTEGVCLMVKEGPHVSFIHKSIQEFFAASCISKLTDNSLLKKIYKTFYTSAKKEYEWSEELEFLKLLDKSRFEEYYEREKHLNFLEFFEVDKKEAKVVKFLKFVKDISVLINVEMGEKTTQFMLVESESINSIFIDILRQHYPHVWPISMKDKENIISNVAKNPDLKRSAIAFDRKIYNRFDEVIDSQISKSSAFVSRVDSRVSRSRTTASDLMLGGKT